MSDNRRDQLIEFVEREFIGPDPIDWPGMTQRNGQEILASDPPRTRYIAGILYPAETTDDKADLKDDECELLDEADGEDVEVKPCRHLYKSPRHGPRHWRTLGKQV